MQSSLLLTTVQAAKILGLKPETLARWRILGTYDLPYVKTGRLVRYKRQDIDAFIESRRCTSE